MNSQICGLTYRNFRNTETIRPVELKIVMQIDHIAVIEASVWAALVFVLLSVGHLLWVVQMRMRSRPSAWLPALLDSTWQAISSDFVYDKSSFSRRSRSLIAEDVVFLIS